jgi:hypothetical protein
MKFLRLFAREHGGGFRLKTVLPKLDAHGACSCGVFPNSSAPGALRAAMQRRNSRWMCVDREEAHPTNSLYSAGQHKFRAARSIGR